MGKRKEEKIGPTVKDIKILREFSAGGVVYRGNKWLVRATNPSNLFPKLNWTLPKGWIDEGETPEQAAVREVGEEGGVEAKIVKKVETIRYFFRHPERGNILKFVTFYLMEYVSDLPDGFGEETSEVLWLNFEDACKKLSYSGERQILKKAKEIFDTMNLQSSLV